MLLVLYLHGIYNYYIEISDGDNVATISFAFILSVCSYAVRGSNQVF